MFTMKMGGLLIVDGNIPTGALNFLPRIDMVGRDSVGLVRGFKRGCEASLLGFSGSLMAIGVLIS